VLCASAAAAEILALSQAVGFNRTYLLPDCLRVRRGRAAPMPMLARRAAGGGAGHMRDARGGARGGAALLAAAAVRCTVHLGSTNTLNFNSLPYPKLIT
jgi:hypothetical protein